MKLLIMNWQLSRLLAYQVIVTEGVYAIVNKLTHVTEAEVPFLVQAYEGLHEMQATLDDWRDKFAEKTRKKEEESKVLIN